MKTKVHHLPAALAALALLSTINSQLSTALGQGTAFTYQGQLQNNGAPTGGTYNFQFVLYTNSSGGTAVAGPVATNGVTVSNGLFTVLMDFGASVWNGSTNWLEVDVETNGGASFTTLAPRQQLTPTPYAIFSETSETSSNLSGTVSASQLSGQLNNSQLANSSVTVTAGTGLSGGGAVALGAATTLNNAGVLSVSAAAPLASTGGQNPTISVTGSVLTNNAPSVTFSNLTLTGSLFLPLTGTTPQATIYSGTASLLRNDANANIFVGYQAGALSGAGANNTALGVGALEDVNGGGDNVAIGWQALHDGNTGLAQYNVAVGAQALESDTQGPQNTAVGANALISLSNGSGNTAVGYAAANGNNGTDNTVIGVQALHNTSTASYDTAVGAQALGDNTTGSYNTALGYSTMIGNSTGSYNAAVGYSALAGNGVGSSNATLGSYALFNNSAGSNNVAVGPSALYENRNGSLNVALGPQALYLLGVNGVATGTNNIALGLNAGTNLLTGSSNIYIGSFGGTTNENNTIRIGTPGVHTNTVIAGVITGDGSGLTNLSVSVTSSQSNGVAMGAGSSNMIAGGVIDAFIGGGLSNKVTSGANYAVIGGGDNNTASGTEATIAGGTSNTVSAADGTIGGGFGNDVQSGSIGGFIGGGQNNTASFASATVGGGVNNSVSGFGSFVGGGGFDGHNTSGNTNAGYAAAIVGGIGNQIQSGYSGSFIGGGYFNTNAGDYCTVGGGSFNSVSLFSSTVAGGTGNIANGTANGFCTVGGGQNNAASGDSSTVGGGNLNVASGTGSFIGGGGYDGTTSSGNTNAGNAAVIAGGLGNNINSEGTYSVIAGGQNNVIGDISLHEGELQGSFIGGGISNQIITPMYNGTLLLGCAIVGGAENAIEGGPSEFEGPGETYSIIGGGQGNLMVIDSYSTGNVIGGGISNSIESASLSFIGGGQNNQATGLGSFIGGGGYDGATTSGNTNAGYAAAIVGGLGNQILSGANESFIGGGSDNTNADSYCVIAGGLNNAAEVLFDTVGGGEGNTAGGSPGPGSFRRGYCTVGGGQGNIAGGNEDEVGGFDTVAGGDGNIASGGESTVSGGARNTAGGLLATIPGGSENVASGNTSFAAGVYAQALNDHTFVWSDGSVNPFASTANSQFLINASGGVGIGENAPAGALHITGPTSAPPSTQPSADNGLVLGTTGTSGYKWIQSFGGDLILNPTSNNVGIDNTSPNHLLVVGSGGAYCDGTSWVNGSDRNSKHDFAVINTGDVLRKVAALPISEWQYKITPDGVKHIGPMAQDFHDAFGLNGDDDKHISTVDEGGVALAAIQGLNQKLEAELKRRDAENAELKAQNDSLAKRLEKLEQIITAKNGGDR